MGRSPSYAKHQGLGFPSPFSRSSRPLAQISTLSVSGLRLGKSTKLDRKPIHLSKPHRGIRCPTRACKVEKRMLAAVEIDQVDAEVTIPPGRCARRTARTHHRVNGNASNGRQQRAKRDDAYIARGRHGIGTVEDVDRKFDVLLMLRLERRSIVRVRGRRSAAGGRAGRKTACMGGRGGAGGARLASGPCTRKIVIAVHERSNAMHLAARVLEARASGGNK